ncbi:MAG: TetR/AcrR family transcriptional regulator [Myxococcota bacterium]|nr:TetR/AcrR family transcriptional regulator [Myxococcota bacterium]
MNPASTRTGALQRLNLPGLKVPPPLMPPETESRLTPRQRQVLDSLETLVVQEELAEMTMAQIAAQVNCSLRTLYGISPSKDELVLTVTDRRLHRIGRAAIEALDPEASPLENLRLYLRLAHEALQPAAGSLIHGYSKTRGARRLGDAHESYLVGIVQGLLDQARERSEIIEVDTAVMAHVLGGLGRDLLLLDLASYSWESPKQAADAATEIILRGLRAD